MSWRHLFEYRDDVAVDQNAVQDQVDNSPPEKQAETAATLSRFVRAAQRIGEDAARARRLARALADLARDSTARSAFMRVSARDCVQRSVDVFPIKATSEHGCTSIPRAISSSWGQTS